MFKRFLLYIILLSVFQLVSPSFMNAGEPVRSSDDPQQKAISLFDEGKFDEALPVFEDLIRLHPEDKMLNYYLGASLVETKNYGTRTCDVLLNSVNRNNPDKIYYYLGMAFHAENDYLSALNYYHRFEKEANGKTKKTVDYQKLIELCERGANPFVVKNEEAQVVDSVKNISFVAEATVADTIKISEQKKVVENFVIPAGLYDSIIVFQVTPEIQYMKIRQFRSAEAQISFVKGWLKKQELDSIILVTDNLRGKYTHAVPDEKQLLTGQILDNEQKIISLNREIPEYNLIAHQVENTYWENPSSDEVEKLLAQNQAITDSLELLRAGKQDKIGLLPPENIVLPVIEKEKPKEEDLVNKGVVYKIQIGAFSKEPPEWAQRLFKKLSLIRKISNYTDEKGVTVYTTGELRSYTDAVEMQKQVKLEGIKNASVAAYNDGVRITIAEARKINGE